MNSRPIDAPHLPASIGELSSELGDLAAELRGLATLADQVSSSLSTVASAGVTARRWGPLVVMAMGGTIATIYLWRRTHNTLLDKPAPVGLATTRSPGKLASA